MLLATFLLTIFVDLITGIAVGVVIGALLFLHRMAEAVEVEGGGSLDDVADSRDQTRYDAGQATTATSWSIASAARSFSAPPRAY